MNKKIIGYISFGLGVLSIFVLSQISPLFFDFLKLNPEHALLESFFLIASVCFLSFLVFYISHATNLPSFVIAIFFGMAAHKVLAPIVHDHHSLNAIVGLGATMILFGGGLETPLKNFKKLFWKICSLSFPGLFIAALLFSSVFFLLGKVVGIHVSVITAVLLGAILASTDPAAIIPILKNLRFKNRSVKDVIVSESAVTDVTGTLLTVIFLAFIASGLALNFDSISDWYSSIFTVHTGLILLKQIVFGILFGFLGYLFLELLKKVKHKYGQEFEADFAFFMLVPIIIFTIALSVGGSGYLAAFVAGLAFNLTDHLHETERFFNGTIEGFFKPAIFLLLGALVDIKSLVEYAPLGILIALVFMFIIRPIVVFISLYPFSLFSKEHFSVKDLLFISFVRETGAIPAVLLITVASMAIPDTAPLLPIGMWVILTTLIVGPIFTPLVARKLGVAEDMGKSGEPPFENIQNTTAILATRGQSFVGRLPVVADWSVSRGVQKIVILLSLEDKYSKLLEEEIKILANDEFAKLKNKYEEAGKNIDFSFVSQEGFLEDNITHISRGENLVVALFVGKKMLDFRLEKIKSLGLPIYFID